MSQPKATYTVSCAKCETLDKTHLTRAAADKIAINHWVQFSDHQAIVTPETSITEKPYQGFYYKR